MVAIASIRAFIPILSSRHKLCFTPPRATYIPWKSNSYTAKSPFASALAPLSKFSTHSVGIDTDAAITPLPLEIEAPKQQQPRVQSLDYSSLVACAVFLRRHWIPARVEEAIQYSPCAVALHLRTLQSSAWLYISWHQSTAHLGISRNGPHRGAVSEAFHFGANIHSSLRGLILTNASIPLTWERVARLDFAARPGDAPSFVLQVEIMGRYSNVLLTQGQDDTVMSAGHQVGSKMSSLRAVQVGRIYTLPPPAPGIPPDSLTTLEEWRHCLLQCEASENNRATTIAECCMKTFLGVSPSLMRDMCAAADVDAGTAPSSIVDEGDWQRLYSVWSGWLKSLENESILCMPLFSSGDSRSASPGYSVLLVPSSASSSSSTTTISTSDRGGSDNNSTSDIQQPVLDINTLEVLRSYYSSFEGADDFEKLKHRVVKGIVNGLGRLTKKIASLQSQQADPTIHAATHHLADLVMANLHLIKPKATEVTVLDWDTNKDVVIPLDPEKTAVASAEVLYAKARKQRRAEEQVAPLIEEATAQIEYLQEVECMVGQLIDNNEEDATALRQTEAELVAGGYLKPEASAALAIKAASKARKANKKSGKQPGGRDDYRRYISPGGFTVLVGRNSSQNDVLTTRLAKSGDVWMHARGVPGAHVLLQVPAGKSVDQEDLQYAADIAAFFSKSRMENKTDITLAHPGDITKPRGAKPGQVMVKKERVMVGRAGDSAPCLSGEN